MGSAAVTRGDEHDFMRDTYECFLCHRPGPHHRKTGMRAHSDCWIRAMYRAYAVQMR